MLNITEIGQSGLAKPLAQEVIDQFEIEMVRSFDAYQKVVAVRTLTFLGEQDCPYEEEFDGNDMCASHLLAHYKGQPIATLRLRWFAGFGKIERVCVLEAHRSSGVSKVLLAAACEIAARKGFRRMTAQLQARLWQLWSKTLNCELIEDRPSVYFSDLEYKEMVISIKAHPEAIRMTSDPYVVIRPEGEWDQPGVLDASQERGGDDLQTVAA